jgi:hypothetical protein
MKIDTYRPMAVGYCCLLASPVFGFAPRRAYSISRLALVVADRPLMSSSKFYPDDFTISDDDTADGADAWTPPKDFKIDPKYETTTRKPPPPSISYEGMDTPKAQPSESRGSSGNDALLPTRRSSTSKVVKAPKVTKVSPSGSDSDSDSERHDGWKAPSKPKRNKDTNMVGTNWMQKNQKFEPLPEDAEIVVRRTEGLRRGVQPPGEQPRSFREDFRGTRVFVQGIPPHVTWQELKDHFKVAGDVVFASVSSDPMTGKSKGHGIVQFESTAMAKHAIQIMRNEPLDGVTLYVRPDVQEGSEGAVLRHVSPGGGDGPTPPTTWKCADEAQLEYLAEAEYKGIRSLIKARDSARRRKNFEASDDMRDQLKKSYGVHLDDRLKMWWISWDGKVVPDNVASVKGDGRWGGLEPWRQIPTTTENDACVDPDLVNGLLKQRDIARREKDFRTADLLLEQARQAPSNQLHLRIHDESRTWRIWTEAPPPRPVDEIYGNDRNDEEAPVLSAAEQCIAIVQANAPNKVPEITNLLAQFPGREYNILKKIKQQYLS